MVVETTRDFDVPATLRNPQPLDPASKMTVADIVGMLGRFGGDGFIIGEFTGLTPWEIHPEADEFLFAVEGEVEIAILTETGLRHSILRRGDACILPRALWHRQFSPSAVKLLRISSADPVFRADDPSFEPDLEG